jgi:hypothetical protein
MRADTQVQVLSAINDHGQIQLQMKLDPLPDLLADLELPNGEVNRASPTCTSWASSSV